MVFQIDFVQHFKILFLVILSGCVKLCSAQESGSCYGSGSIALSVVLTFIFTVLLLIGGYYLWQKRKNRQEHLILETDPEKGKGEFAFDNPGFKDATLLATSTSETNKKSKLDGPKWNQWSPLNVLTKHDKRKALDDTAIEESEVKVVALRSHDFTGLGFNICGNIKEGIYIKDILHRGPAFESGKLNPGDKITSVTISFEHMVCEDALTILSYASPYEVIIEARSSKGLHNDSNGAQPGHPVYRSSSCTNLFYDDKIKKGHDSNNSSLQKSRSNLTTLERKKSKSPKPSLHLKNPLKHLSPKQLKMQLENKISEHHKSPSATPPSKVESEMQKSENKHQKFGIKVLPFENQQKSPKSSELSQNDNNINIEKHSGDVIIGIDEVDIQKPVPPQVKKREKKPESTSVPASTLTSTTLQKEEESHLTKGSTLNSSGIKRDKNGIPQEIPSHMLNAAVAARRNRKSSCENSQDDISDATTPKRLKGKAPMPPPDDSKSIDSDKLEKEYNSDSDLEIDNQSSVNTIELNSSDITIHQSEEENLQNRKTASTGDLTKIKPKSNSGTLERAQSLDITDTGMTGTLKRKAANIEDIFDMKSDDDLFGKVMLNKAPRLSLILDSLNPIQKKSLKKSTEWGNLEDAIKKLNQEDEIHFEETKYNRDFDFGEKTPEFDALVKKINEIKRESQEILPEDVDFSKMPEVKERKDKIKRNNIWPTFEELNKESKPNGDVIDLERPPQIQERKSLVNAFPNKTQIKKEDSIKDVKYPAIPERSKIPNKINLDMQIVNCNDDIDTDVVLRHKSDDYGIKKINDLRENNKNGEEFTDNYKINNLEIVQPEFENQYNEKDTKLISEDKVPNVKNDELCKTVVIEPQVEKRHLVTDHDCTSQEVGSKVAQTQIKAVSDTVKTESSNKSTIILNKDEPIAQSKIPVLSSYNTDETKTVLTSPSEVKSENVVGVTENFLFTERINCSKDNYIPHLPVDDRSISDDIKISTRTYESLEKTSSLPDDVKSLDCRNVSSITINNDTELHSLEFSVNDTNSDMFITALETPVEATTPDKDLSITSDSSQVTVSTPNSVNSLKSFDEVTISNLPPLKPSMIPKPQERIFKISSPPESNNEQEKSDSQSSLTYITEIKVTPTASNSSNISEIEIIPSNNNLDNEFEKYVKNFDCNYEPNIPNFEKSLEEFIKEEPKSLSLNEKQDEKELHKIQEIAEKQLKKLPEMRFVTASYESTKPVENSHSHIDLLKMNFEKTPPSKLSKPETTTKSRIPVATTTKTPPVSPERRDSKILDQENDKAILELMNSNTVHSTPLVSNSKLKSPKNVTVTSIRNSKIPSGLPRHHLSPRKIDLNNGDTSATNINISSGSSDNSESHIQQWVFRPSSTSVTNISVSESKRKV